MNRRKKNPEPDHGSERVPGVMVTHTLSGTVSAETVVTPTFTAFYRGAYPDVARALIVTLGDRDLAKEAADEAMVRCYARWSTVRRYDNPAGWVYRVGLNWATSVRRRLSLRNRKPVAAPEPTTFSATDPDVERSLRELDLDLRAVVVCRLMLDWSVDETATALGIPAGTVKSRLSRALGRLEQKLYHLNEER